MRPRNSARLRIFATASFVTFCVSTPPETPTGVAAPISEPGAIAATGQLIMMNAPALAARAPWGDTKQITGTRELRIDWMMSSIELDRPPGVSIVRSTAASLLAFADSIPCWR